MITVTAPKTTIANFLNNAKAHLETSEEGIKDRDYHDHKTAQLIGALAELQMVEALIQSWFVDLGFDGQCQAEEVDEVAMMKLDEPVSEERLAYIADCVRQSKIADGTIEDSSIGGIPCISSRETS